MSIAKVGLELRVVVWVALGVEFNIQLWLSYY
jgi:hypothetical protein